jgi:hypothetical protein
VSSSLTADGASIMSSNTGHHENLPSSEIAASSTICFPVGPCLPASHCSAPTHELQKHCPGCGKYIHVLCGRVLEEDEGLFPADSGARLGCNLKNNIGGCVHPG